MSALATSPRASGSLNALHNVKFSPPDHRFGPEIAFMAECCLAGLVRKSGAKAPPLVGSGKADWVIGEEEVTKKTTIAVISRTNFGQFEEMVKLVCQQPKYARPKIALPSPPNTEDPYGWDLLVDLAYYCIGQRENMSLKAQKNKRYKFANI